MSNFLKKLNEKIIKENIWEKNISFLKKRWGTEGYNYILHQVGNHVQIIHPTSNSAEGQYFYNIYFKTGKISIECDVCTVEKNVLLDEKTIQHIENDLESKI